MAFEQQIEEAARRHNIDSSLLWSVVKTESGFDPKAVSSKGAIGLGQLMPTTAKDMGVKDPYDPVQNLDGSAKYLSQLMTRQVPLPIDDQV
jgi:soluble lytic murein transglycosylase